MKAPATAAYSEVTFDDVMYVHLSGVRQWWNARGHHTTLTITDLGRGGTRAIYECNSDWKQDSQVRGQKTYVS